jgi:hypothetical protein
MKILSARKMKLKNKKADLKEETFGIVIGFLCLLVLFYFALKLTGVVGISDLTKANSTLIQLSDKINSLESGKATDFVYQNPKNWYLKSYNNPMGYPNGNGCGNSKSCLCLCKNINCDSSLTCRGFDLNVSVGDPIKITAVEGLRITRQNSELKINKIK